MIVCRMAREDHLRDNLSAAQNSRGGANVALIDGDS
jgi:hypothetical protein